MKKMIEIDETTAQRCVWALEKAINAYRDDRLGGATAKLAAQKLEEALRNLRAAMSPKKSVKPSGEPDYLGNKRIERRTW